MSRRREPLVRIDTLQAPPRWALLQRHLIDTQAEACRAFFDKYFDPCSGHITSNGLVHDQLLKIVTDSSA